MPQARAQSAMGRIGSGALLAGLIAALAAPLAAQQADAAAGEDDPAIIVQGERELDSKELRDAVRDVAMRGREAKRPLMRYQVPLCPRTIGFPARMGAYVVERIRRNTLDAGLAVDEDADGCIANALVIVVDDPDTLIKRMRQTNPDLFNVRINRDIKAAQNRGDAAIVWSHYAMQGPNGRGGAASGAMASNTLEGSFANAGGAPRDMRLSFPSTVFIPYSLEKMATIMVFDVDRLDGVHLDQLADFATLRILGQPQPTIDIEQDGAVSILNLFDAEPAAAPREMTRLDRAYLRGLYAMRPNDPSTRLEYFVTLAYQELDAAEAASAAPQPAAAMGAP